MATRNVRFIATETVAKPTRVRFKTKSGQTVSFKAIKTVKVKKAVASPAKKK